MTNQYLTVSSSQMTTLVAKIMQDIAAAAQAGKTVHKALVEIVGAGADALGQEAVGEPASRPLPSAAVGRPSTRRRAVAANITTVSTMTSVRYCSGMGAKGSARKTKSSITSPSKTRSMITVARLEVMAMSCRRLST